MALETVRVSKQGRDQLITLKRRTRIENWNVICRWALCLSLTEEAPPRDEPAVGEHPVEMTWRTFAGDDTDVYLALLKHRCHLDGLEITDDNLAKQLRLHLHRGIAYLAGNRSLNSIVKLVRKVVPDEQTS